MNLDNVPAAKDYKDKDLDAAVVQVSSRFPFLCFFLFNGLLIPVAAVNHFSNYSTAAASVFFSDRDVNDASSCLSDPRLRFHRCSLPAGHQLAPAYLQRALLFHSRGFSLFTNRF